MSFCCTNTKELGCLHHCDTLEVADDANYSGEYYIEYFGANHTIIELKTKNASDSYIVDASNLNEVGCYSFRILDNNKELITVQSFDCFKIKIYA